MSLSNNATLEMVKNLSEDIEDIKDGTTTVSKATEAQHLKEFLVENTLGTDGIGWWKIGSVSKDDVASQAAQGIIFLINEIYNRSASGYGQSGMLELDLQTTSGTGFTHAGLNILAGNLSKEQICLVWTADLVELYYYLDTTYEGTIWTILSQGNEANNYKDAFVSDNTYYGTSAPSDASYAVVRNIASEADTADTVSAIALTSNADLNDCVPDTVGQAVIYYASTNGIAATISNIPSAVTTSFKVTAIKLYDSGTDLRCVQELRDNANHYYIRRATSSTAWTDWIEVALATGTYSDMTVGTAAACTGNAATATRLATARTIRTNLASTDAVSFDGQANILTGVTGTLAVGNGGTGLTASPSMLVNLESETAANVLQASPRPGVTGILPVANGGTGASSLTDAGIVTLTGSQTITGSKTFGILYATTPSSGNDSTRVATTEWVNDLVENGSYASATYTIIESSDYSDSGGSSGTVYVRRLYVDGIYIISGYINFSSDVDADSWISIDLSSAIPGYIVRSVVAVGRKDNLDSYPPQLVAYANSSSSSPMMYIGVDYRSAPGIYFIAYCS